MASFSKIKTIEQAFAKKGIDIATIPTLDGLPERFRKALIAQYQLWVVAEAINEDWEADWDNLAQRKYFPWWAVKANFNNPAGVGLSYDDYVYVGSYTIVGSRLSLRSSEAVEHIQKYFTPLYEATMLKQP